MTAGHRWNALTGTENGTCSAKKVKKGTGEGATLRRHLSIRHDSGGELAVIQ